MLVISPNPKSLRAISTDTEYWLDIEAPTTVNGAKGITPSCAMTSPTLRPTLDPGDRTSEEATTIGTIYPVSLTG